MRVDKLVFCFWLSKRRVQTTKQKIYTYITSANDWRAERDGICCNLVAVLGCLLLSPLVRLSRPFSHPFRTYPFFLHRHARRPCCIWFHGSSVNLSLSFHPFFFLFAYCAYTHHLLPPPPEHLHAFASFPSRPSLIGFIPKPFVGPGLCLFFSFLLLNWPVSWWGTFV